MKKQTSPIKQDILKDYAIPFNPQQVWEREVGYHKLEWHKKQYCGCCGSLIDLCTCGHKNKLKDRPKYNKIKCRVNYQNNAYYYTIVSTIDNQLVFRTFVIWTTEEVNRKASPFKCYEVMRKAFDEKGKITFARIGVCGFMYQWDWNYGTDFTVKPYQTNSKYDMEYDIRVYKKPKWAKYLDVKAYQRTMETLKKFNRYYSCSIDIKDYVKKYLENPVFFETLTKLKRYDLLGLWFKYYSNTTAIMTLARKNKEMPTTDIHTYSDYLNGLETLNKDLKNIDIVCPKDFTEANKRVEKQCRKIKDQEQLKKEMEKNNDYVARVEKLIGLDFGNGKYHVLILPSIEAFKEEADHMCHCVYRMKYYDKQSSYIFSIRNSEMKRLETAEIIIDKKIEPRVNQCYGYGDKYTKYHKVITHLLNTKLNEIKGVLLQ